MSQMVITAVGPDRPGLVGEFTGHLHSAGANIADSRMVNLRGQFALILLVEGTDPTLQAIQKTLPRAVQGIGLSVTFASQSAPTTQPQGLPFHLRTYSMDQPGIVHRVTHLLHSHGINIEELQTRLESGAFMGTPLFTMDLRLTVPSTVSVRRLRSDLDAISDQLNCDIDLEPG